ncbi:MAG: hypothetical protein HKP06_11770 [Flavobacteriaceae bacterium]|nr:hypothetical protein [Flavobacteriaceae bacterium]NNK61476.1 hypothetical protein [Flavobacteriaceae bacterium]
MSNRRDSNIPSWNWIARVGNNRVTKSSYYWIFFVPFIAKLIEKLPDIPSLDLPFSWKIFFFSSLFFGIGTLLYEWKCPDLVKKYATWEEFKKVGLTKNQLLIFFSNWLRNGGEIRSAENDVVPHYEAVETVYEKFSDQSRPDLLRINDAWHSAKFIPLQDKFENDAFWYIRGLMYNDKLTWRIIIAIIYIIGFLLVGLLIGINTYYVFKATF